MSCLIKKQMNCSMPQNTSEPINEKDRAGHYERKLTTTSGDVNLKVPKLKGIPFETAIIERYRCHECSVNGALIEKYLAGVSVDLAENITEAL